MWKNTGTLKDFVWNREGQSSCLRSFMESVPDVVVKLKQPEFKDVVKSAA
jgi:hypothetical protein